MSLPAVTVVIPTYKDWASLERCVSAMDEINYPANLLSIVVADNDPETSLQKISSKQELEIIKVCKKGSYAARNEAIKKSFGDIVAFTDADCIPDPLWIRSAVDCLNNGYDRVAGKVELTFSDGKLSWAEIYEKALSFQQDENAKEGFAITANLIVKREIFDEVGLFNDQLLSGGDKEWNRRATKLGKSIVYSEESKVQHPARSSISSLMKKRKRVAGGSIVINGFHIGSVVKGLIPPVAVWKKLNKNECLSAREKKIAFAVFYFLKIYKSYIVTMLRLGLIKPSRS